MRSEDDFSAIQETDDKKEVVDMVGDGGSPSCDNWVATLRSATVGLVLLGWFMVDKISKGRVRRKKERRKKEIKKKVGMIKERGTCDLCLWYDPIDPTRISYPTCWLYYNQSPDLWCLFYSIVMQCYWNFHTSSEVKPSWASIPVKVPCV